MSTMPQIAPEFRPGRNRSGSTIGKYLCVKRDASNLPNGLTLTAADTDVAVGVTGEEIANNANGNVCIKGRHPVTANGAITAGLRIACEANGKVKAAASGDTVIGVAEEAALADNDVILAELNFPGVFW